MTGEERTAEFAERLRELKERSGRSYGMLAKRLHMSTSTLHRYCNGDAVPADYAPVERFARVCGASPEELVSLHRAWVLADANRRRATPTADDAPGAVDDAPAAAGTAPGAAESGSRPAPADGAPAGEPDTPLHRPSGVPAATTTGAATGAVDGGATGTGAAEAGAAEPAATADHPVAGPTPTSDAPADAHPRARRRLLVASAVAAVASVVLAGTLITRHGPDGGDAPDRTAAAGAQASPTGARASASPSVSASPDGSPDKDKDKDRDGRSAGPASPSAARDEADAPAATGTPLTVSTRPHVWEGPCSQHYLVNRPPAEVPPPPAEPDAAGWVAALGAVPAGDQMIALTVQASGKETVVLDALHVRVLSSSAPLAWNDFAMGVGCGGNVSTRSFDVRLDDPRPTARPRNGQGAFPYKVTASEPLVVYVTAHAAARDVRWALDLEWSSGGRSGTIRVDDSGNPFRTSGNKGRPRYDYPLGGTSWNVPLE
ncbi:helix-turn-helix domain-containing protein [Streptomyces sp. NPDC005012]|uniref:transcriptional regulator n=1 Tax=Streptomyces sp. NPDC005012 TaxID=3154558 RepID=UPI0033B43F3B